MPAEQQQVETEPFPGSSSLDWQSGLLGLRDRAQGRALDNIVVAVGKQFRPVSVYGTSSHLVLMTLKISNFLFFF